MTVIPSGALARFTESTLDRSEGDTFIVEMHVTAEEAEDSDKGFYWGSTPGNFNDVQVDEDKVEMVLSPDQVKARKPPSTRKMSEIVLDGLMHHMVDGYEIEAAERDSDTTVIAYGETPEGLRFASRIEVKSIWEVDF